MIDFNNFNENISDEMLAAYIDGNATESEKSLIENSISDDSMLSEAVDIANDANSLDNGFDWELHKGDYGLWELGLPPVVSEDDIIENVNNSEYMMGNKNYGYEPNNELDIFDPNIWQGNQPTCAIRSQEIILRDYGIYHTQDDLVDFATKNGWFNPDPEKGGTDKYAIGNILDACGIPTTRMDNATIYDIISELKAGHRVIVSVDANELWVRKEPNVFKRILAQVTNKANDKIQDFLGLEGANHALIVAGVNVNPKDPSDIKVTLIDPGTGDVCIDYSFKEFNDAWSDGHCLMISTDIPAPFQYNYHTHQIEPSNIATTYSPSLAQMPVELVNQFRLSEDYFNEYKGYSPKYDQITMIEGVDEMDVRDGLLSSKSDINDPRINDSVQTDYEIKSQEEFQKEENSDENICDSETLSSSTDDVNYGSQEEYNTTLPSYEIDDEQSDDI